MRSETTRGDRLDPEQTTVHEVLRRWSGARAVFARHAIDTCCGGELPLTLAAERHGVDPTTLLAALEAVRDEPDTPASPETCTAHGRPAPRPRGG